MSSAFVRNGRMDVIAHNTLARAVHAPMFDSATTSEYGRANIARFHFLDPVARRFFVDWYAACHATVALLRAEAGREPHDRALRELIGELSTLSPEFRKQWAAHDVRIRHDGVKRLRHPEAGDLELTYQSLDPPLSDRAMHDLTIYTAEPGTRSEERLRLLASWTAPSPRRRPRAPGTPAEPTRQGAAAVNRGQVAEP